MARTAIALRGLRFGFLQDWDVGVCVSQMRSPFPRALACSNPTAIDEHEIGEETLDRSMVI
jgi:hypothetical protein